jgi:hypothetical protein
MNEISVAVIAYYSFLDSVTQSPFAPVCLAVGFEAQVCCRLVAGIVGSDPTEGIDISLLCFLCVVWIAAFAMSCSLVQRSPNWRARACVCVMVCDLETSTMRWHRPVLGYGATKK